MSRTFTIEEVSGHSTTDNLYLIVDRKAYDVTGFQHEHPGGDEFLLDQGRQDVTELFEDAGHSDEVRKILETIQIGTVDGESNSAAALSDEMPRKQDGGLTLTCTLTVLCAMIAYVLFLTCLGNIGRKKRGIWVFIAF
ncbi:cytochrome b5-like heme/steroid binding domain-containing protein [Aspergillus alliaceus]|uniref:cytochrome b5-like heme/steroid binding domain-containing protein n=1 Tax=Petromyces alliaceus TaxID=209559 RepID=UPI0012A443F6|nr:cytochrome b5-like heme/steroid binding domain-containing protein [Aspergillus alliaceus]KAB8228886.1 cytochrome b5-like heme/steroid binding domain-containing protein [Aspergillus alliaceus]